MPREEHQGRIGLGDKIRVEYDEQWFNCTSSCDDFLHTVEPYIEKAAIADIVREELIAQQPELRPVTAGEAIERIWLKEGDPAGTPGGVKGFVARIEQVYGWHIKQRTAEYHLARLRRRDRNVVKLRLDRNVVGFRKSLRKVGGS